jgi:YidC/Oxa1 family membrane protein insertase
MDRKSIITLVACFALFLLMPHLARKIYPDKPLPPGVTNVVSKTVTGTPPAVPLTNTSAPPVASLEPLTTPLPVLPVRLEEPANLIELTNENARYTFTPNGGGVKLIELLHFPETVSRKRKQPAQRVAGLNTAAPLPVMAVLGEGLTGDGVFELSRTIGGVRATKTLTNGLAIVKEFTLSTNYLVATTVRLENKSGVSLLLPAQEYVVGTATPMGPADDGTAVGMSWYNGAGKQEVLGTWFANASFLSCVGMATKEPRVEHRAGTSNVVWAAAHNQFFSMVAMPAVPAEQVVARAIQLPRPADIEPRYASRPAPKGYMTTLVYPAVTLAPGQKLERQIFLFAGPKEYRTLARVATSFNNNVDAVMGFGGFFGFFSKGLLLAMNWIHDVFRLGYGLAIIAITIIIKALFWPLTQASTRSMKRMAALQPQTKALQEKYKDDPVKMNKKMMEFWKENKVNPVSGCLPMLIQMPVFIGFFYMIRSAIELRGASFLWIGDLSQPDTLFIIPGLNFPFNPLPLLMGVTMLWQSHMTPPSPGMDPTQQKMMRYMPLMFLFMLYNFSAGLTLYWTVQNLLSILQMKLTKSNQPATGAPIPANALPPKKWK